MIIEIWTKEKYSGSEEAGLISRLTHAGLDLKEAKLSRLYRIEALWPKKDFEKLAEGLLTDNITEKSSLAVRPGFKGFYRVEVWLKNSATDVIGESVREAIHDMLGRSPSSVRFGRAYYVSCSSEARLKSVISKVLVNETVNIFKIETI